MPCFYFDVYDGFSGRDSVGTELHDWREARREAIRLAGCLLDDSPDDAVHVDPWFIEVRTAAGFVLFRLDVLMQTADVTEPGPIDGPSVPAPP